MKLEGMGTIVNGSFLIGHYYEVGSLRRRFGTIFYTLGGDGKTWSGPFVFVDPDTASPNAEAIGKWVKKN
jgi:hypothetical protein